MRLLPVKTWTEDEERYLTDHYGKSTLCDIARALNKTVPSVAGKAGVLGLRRKKEQTWTPEEESFLRENWDRLTINGLCKKLNRSKIAVNVKARRMKLGPQKDQGKFTLSELCNLLHIDHRKIKRLIDNGFISAAKAPKKTSRGNCIYLFSPKEVERFLKEQPEQWDSRRSDDIIKALRAKELEGDKYKIQRKEGKQIRQMPEHLKGSFVLFVVDVAMSASDRIQAARRDPDWLKEKKEKDSDKEYPRELLRWTLEEDNELRLMFKSGHLTYKQMGERLGRSEASVGNRLARIVVWEHTKKKGA